MSIYDFLALLQGPAYCPCCGDSVNNEGYCSDCEGYSMPELSAELPELSEV
jgi:hypothetical protein